MVFVSAFCCTIASCSGPLVYRPVKETIQVTTVVTEAKNNLPPLPDTMANNATLAGIDTTKMGIRDDVHIWIYTNYTTTIKRTILLTMAKALHDVVVKTPNTKEEAKNLEKSFKDASIMLKVVRGLKPSEADEMGALLYNQIFNTPERLKTYLHFNLLLSDSKPRTK
jgi:hypothetical protein